MSTLLKFVYGVNTLQFEAGGDYPAKRTSEILQVQDRTAAGTLKVETLGVNIKTRTISFNLMSLSDYQNLFDWFENIVNGGAEIFEFTDEYGTVSNVRITDSILSFDETSLQRFSGSITLEYQ